MGQRNIGKIYEAFLFHHDFIFSWIGTCGKLVLFRRCVLRVTSYEPTIFLPASVLLQPLFAIATGSSMEPLSATCWYFAFGRNRNSPWHSDREW